MDLRRALRQFDASIAREIGRKARVTLGLGPKPTPGVPLYAEPMSRIGALSRLGGSILYRSTLPVALYNQAREVFNPRDNIVTSLQNLGVSINNLGKPLSQRDYIPNVNRPFIREYNRRIFASRKPPGQAPTDAELAAQGFGFGVREYDPLERRILPAGTVLTGSRFSGLTPSGEVDRRRSDDYRQYAGTPAPTRSYDQYAGTPEEQFKAIFLDRVKGGYGDLSKAKGAPKDAQGMLVLASQPTAPLGTDPNAYYAAQHAAGKIRQDQLVEYFGQRSQGLGEWAKAFPALAYRQFMKESRRGGQMDAGTVAALKTIDEAKDDKSSIGDRVDNFLKYIAEPKNPLAPRPGDYLEKQGEQVRIELSEEDKERFLGGSPLPTSFGTLK